MKYFIPFRLDRAITIGPYHIRDLLILAVLLYISVSLMFTNPAYMFPTVFFAISQIRIESRTIGSHMIKAMKFLLRQNNFSIKDIYRQEVQ